MVRRSGAVASSHSLDADVVVVGTGNAAFAAALSAAELGASVLMLERGDDEWIGGNSYFTAGAFRFAHDGRDDVATLLDEAPGGHVDLDPYSAEAFRDDMLRVTEGLTDPDLLRPLVDDSRAGVDWLHGLGVRWRLMYERQAQVVDGRTRFWGGLAVGTVNGGKGLIETYTARARERGIRIETNSSVTGLRRHADRVELLIGNQDRSVSAAAAVLAAGGFEANPQLRARHLGPAWDVALVRGTPHNRGEALLAALDAGAQAHGQWSGAHAVPWDAAAPDSGDRELTNRYSRLGYPYGLMVNREGRRFVDEGADLRNYTYAKYGVEILRQPAGRAFQLFDAKTVGLVSQVDYGTAGASRTSAASWTQLAAKTSLPAPTLIETIEAFNAGVQEGTFDPTTRDGKGTDRVLPAKSNWAQPLDTPPYTAFEVTCGITFTFGGVRITPRGEILDRTGDVMPGLFAAGEMVGGIFHHNYPGGSGLTAGLVFGRRAGDAAARHAGTQ